jgi:hypothetical protein
MFVITGALGAMISLGAYAFPSVRNAEDILPDYDAAALQNLGALKPAQTAERTRDSSYQQSDKQAHASAN